MTQADNETVLIDTAQKGDLQAFGKLVDLHQMAIRAFFAVRTGNPHDAEDLAQEVFLTAHRKLDSFQVEKPFAPWLRGIAFNLLLNHRRKLKMEPIGSSADIENLLNFRVDQRQQDEDQAAFVTALRVCMQKLEAPDRDIMLKRYFKDFSIAQLAKDIGKKHSAMTMHIHRIRLALKECIKWRLSAS